MFSLKSARNCSVFIKTSEKTNFNVANVPIKPFFTIQQVLEFPFSNCLFHLAIVRVPIQQTCIPFSKHISHLANIYSIQQTFIPFSKSHYLIAVSCQKAISRTALAYGLAVKKVAYLRNYKQIVIFTCQNGQCETFRIE